jgi:hypothetical protein
MTPSRSASFGLPVVLSVILPEFTRRHTGAISAVGMGRSRDKRCPSARTEGQRVVPQVGIRSLTVSKGRGMADQWTQSFAPSVPPVPPTGLVRKHAGLLLLLIVGLAAVGFFIWPTFGGGGGMRTVTYTVTGTVQSARSTTYMSDAGAFHRTPTSRCHTRSRSRCLPDLLWS